MLQRINTTLFKQLPGSSLVFFRIAFGLILLWESIDYYQKGWIARYWIAPDFHFNYHFFEWITPWPGNGMYIHFIVLGIASLLLTLGLFYRLAALILFLATSYVFLLDEARYLNHVYLTILLSFLLIFIPANRQLSGRKTIPPY